MTPCKAGGWPKTTATAPLSHRNVTSIANLIPVDTRPQIQDVGVDGE